MQVSRSRLEFDQVPLLKHQIIFWADFHNVYCHNLYLMKTYFFALLSNFRNCLRTTGNTPQYVSVIRYIMISQDTLFVICKLVDKKWQKLKHNKVILSIASSIFPAPEFYLRERITAISPWQFLSRFCITKSLERPCIFYFMILSQMVISVRRDTSNSSQLSQPTSRSWLLKSGGEPVKFTMMITFPDIWVDWLILFGNQEECQESG